MTCCGVFVSRLVLGWGLEVHSFGLSTEQSEAAFSVAKLVTKEDSHIVVGARSIGGPKWAVLTTSILGPL